MGCISYSPTEIAVDVTPSWWHRQGEEYDGAHGRAAIEVRRLARQLYQESGRRISVEEVARGERYLLRVYIPDADLSRFPEISRLICERIELCGRETRESKP